MASRARSRTLRFERARTAPSPPSPERPRFEVLHSFPTNSGGSGIFKFRESRRVGGGARGGDGVGGGAPCDRTAGTRAQRLIGPM